MHVGLAAKEIRRGHPKLCCYTLNSDAGMAFHNGIIELTLHCW